LTAIGDKPEQYGYVVSRDEKKSCEKQALEQFQEMEKRFNAWLKNTNRQRDEDCSLLTRTRVLSKTVKLITGSAIKEIFRPGICATPYGGNAPSA
jgi:hypothetical protein